MGGRVSAAVRAAAAPSVRRGSNNEKLMPWSGYGAGTGRVGVRWISGPSSLSRHRRRSLALPNSGDCSSRSRRLPSTWMEQDVLAEPGRGRHGQRSFFSARIGPTVHFGAAIPPENTRQSTRCTRQHGAAPLWTRCASGLWTSPARPTARCRQPSQAGSTFKSACKASWSGARLCSSPWRKRSLGQVRRDRAPRMHVLTCWLTVVGIPALVAARLGRRWRAWVQPRY